MAQYFDLGNGEAVCSNPGGRFHGWLFRRHPDGQLVSIGELREIANPIPASAVTTSVDRGRVSVVETNAERGASPALSGG